MSALRITTWNINSLRLRLRLLARVLEETRADVVCLQEIKVSDEEFPHEDVAKLGFTHVMARGMPGYNGVAILARVPIEPGERREFCGKSDARHISAILKGGIELHNLYVPAGGDIPDPVKNDKFAHKLDFVAEVADWFAAQKPAKRILVGDLNIAPLENDVWSHRQLLDVVSHTPVEVERLAKLQASQSWIDAARRFVPADQKLYTWWSYRNRTWPGADRGRRLDHVWITPPLSAALKSAEVLRPARGWKGPSDHVPVTVELAI